MCKRSTPVFSFLATLALIRFFLFVNVVTIFRNHNRYSTFTLAMLFLELTYFAKMSVLSILLFVVSCVVSYDTYFFHLLVYEKNSWQRAFWPSLLEP